MAPEAPGAQPPESPEPPPFTPDPAPAAPQAETPVKIPAQASPSVFESEADSTVKVVPGAASQPAPESVPAPAPAAAPQSAFAAPNDDFLTEAQPSASPRPTDHPGYPPAAAASPGAMPQTTLPSPVAPPAQGYAMTPPPMGSPAAPRPMGAPGGPPPMGSPAGPPPGMQTGPMPMQAAPRKPRNKAAVAFGVIAIVLLAAAATFGILYSEKANDFTDQADRLESVEEERDVLEGEKAELEDEIVALQLERDNLQGDSDARQACSDALDILIADEYPGTLDEIEDLASTEYLEWAQAHDELYREVERQCLA